MGLVGFHVALLLVAIISRKKTNFQMFLFLLTCMWHFLFIFRLNYNCSISFEAASLIPVSFC